MLFAELFVSLMPVVLLFATMTMLVLRAGASRIFFDVVGSFQATRLIGDAQAKITVLQGLVLDGLSGITEGVGLIGEQINALVDSTIPLSQEIGYARIEFEKFLQASDDADILGERIENLGLQFGFSGDQALAAGSKMAQLSSIVGGGESIPAATEVGIAFGMVGGMETEEAMKRLINLQQQTMFMYGGMTQAQYNRLTAEKKANVIRSNSIQLLNQLNTVENRSSATMAQITMVMNQFASSAKLAGDEISYMAAMSATLIEAGEEQGKAGRALKMMYARLGADTNNMSEVLGKYGIQTEGTNGQLRSMHDIIQDMSSAIQGLTKDQQAQAKMELAQALAGNDHYVRAIKLIDGYTRSVELNGMALAELDTAQEELNKRFEDNAFLLTQAEASLVNAKAALGEQFTPAVIRATNAQADLTLAFADGLQGMREMSPVLGKMIDGLMSVTQIGRIYAPFVEAQLNIMSLNVSLQTQLQIQRALAGQDLIRASAYGSQGSQLRANLGTLSATANLEDRRALTQASLLKLNQQNLQVKEQEIFLSQNSLSNNRQELLNAQSLIQQEIATLRVKENQLAVDMATGNDAYLQKEISKVRIGQEKTILQNTKERLNLMTTEQSYLQAAVGLKGYENRSAETLMDYKAKHFMHQRASNILEEHNAQVMQRQADIQAQINALNVAEKDISFSLSTIEKQRLQDLQTELALNADLLANEGKQQIMALMTSKTIGGQSQAQRILRQAHIEVEQAVKMKSSAETQNNVIMGAAEQAARELAFAYGLDEAALMSLLPKMEIFASGLRRVAAQSEAVVAQQMRVNQAMMTGGMALGGMSMALGMFSEDSKAARASMILLNLSMIPMTIQMVSSTAQSYKLMAGASGVAGGMNTAAVATTRFGKALNFVTSKTGIGLLVLGVAALAYALVPAKKEMDDFNGALDDLNTNIQFSQDHYESMLKETENSSRFETVALIATKEGEINNIKSNFSADEALLNYQRSRVSLLEQEILGLKQIDTIKSSQELLGGDAELSASEYYDAVQKAYSSKKPIMPTGQEEFYAEPFEKSYLGLMNTITSGGYGGQTDIMEQYNKDIFAYDQAIRNLPSAYKGAIEEAAKMAKSGDEFVKILTEMGIEANYFGDEAGNMGKSLEDNFIGPIEAAKEAAFEFSNAREEMFFGMAKGNITGDMVKQVVNKGVETLINTTEVIMTNNFTGMTTTQAANEITKQVVSQLNGLGLNLNQA